jgi:hypothetical protein
VLRTGGTVSTVKMWILEIEQFRGKSHVKKHF